MPSNAEVNQWFQTLTIADKEALHSKWQKAKTHQTFFDWVAEKHYVPLKDQKTTLHTPGASKPLPQSLPGASFSAPAISTPTPSPTTTAQQPTTLHTPAPSPTTTATPIAGMMQASIATILSKMPTTLPATPPQTSPAVQQAANNPGLMGQVQQATATVLSKMPAQGASIPQLQPKVVGNAFAPTPTTPKPTSVPTTLPGQFSAFAQHLPGYTPPATQPATPQKSLLQKLEEQLADKAGIRSQVQQTLKQEKEDKKVSLAQEKLDTAMGRERNVQEYGSLRGGFRNFMQYGAGKGLSQGGAEAKGHLQEAMGNESGIGTVGNLMSSLGSILPGPIGGMAKLGGALFGGVDKLQQWSRQLHESNMQFAEFSGSMAKVQAQQEVADIKYKRERGEARAESAERLSRSSNELRQKLAPLGDMVANLKNDTATAFNDTVSGLVSLAENATAAGRALKKIREEEEKKKQKEDERRGGDINEANWLLEAGNKRWEEEWGRPKDF